MSLASFGTSLLAQVTYSSSSSSSGNGAANAAAAGVALVVMLIALVIGLGIACLIIWLISDSVKAVPPQFQLMTPGQVWLMLIPLFNIFWAFMVVTKIPDSFKNFYESTGRPRTDDYGRGVGLGYAICAICSIIPIVGILASIGALVCLILFIVKLRAMKTEVLAMGGSVGGFPVQPTPYPPAQYPPAQ